MDKTKLLQDIATIIAELSPKFQKEDWTDDYNYYPFIMRIRVEDKYINGVDFNGTHVRVSGWYRDQYTLVELKSLTCELLIKVKAQLQRLRDPFAYVYGQLIRYDCDHDDVSSSDDNRYFEIPISWGDWKHSHARLNYIMGLCGYDKAGEEVTESDGSDCYSSIHYYTRKDV